MLERVIVPVEMSAVDTKLLAFARGLGRYGVKELLLFHAADLVGVERPVAERQEAELRERLDRLAGEATGTPQVVPMLEPGDPADAVLRASRHRNADLIICGTRAKSVLDEFALGSVSEALARRSSVPVLLVPFHVLADSSAEEAEAVGATVFDVVHHPTDFSDISEHALDFLKKLGSDRVGRIVLSHGMDRKGMRDEERPSAERSALRVLAAMRAELASVGIEATTELAHGAVVDALLDITIQRGCTCVALGSQGHSMSKELLIGSVSLSILRRAPVPVLLTR